jgi:hypothetical protein
VQDRDLVPYLLSAAENIELVDIENTLKDMNDIKIAMQGADVILDDARIKYLIKSSIWKIIVCCCWFGSIGFPPIVNIKTTFFPVVCKIIPAFIIKERTTFNPQILKEHVFTGK